MKKLFDYRFRGEESKIVTCNSFHKADNMQKHWRKVKNYKNKCFEYEAESSLSNEPKLIWVGKSLHCNRRQVDAVKYYSDKLAEAQAEW